MPKIRAAMPKTGGLAAGFQVWVVNSFHGLCAVSAGIAFQIRKPAIAAITTSRKAPDPAASPRNTRSPRRTERPEIPAASAVGGPPAWMMPTPPALASSPGALAAPARAESSCAGADEESRSSSVIGSVPPVMAMFSSARFPSACRSWMTW